MIENLHILMGSDTAADRWAELLESEGLTVLTGLPAEDQSVDVILSDQPVASEFDRVLRAGRA